MHSSQAALVDGLVADLRAPVLPAPAVSESKMTEAVQQAVQAPVGGLVWNARSIFFLVYILMCIVILIRWEIIRQLR